jgi:hypothetical protein
VSAQLNMLHHPFSKMLLTTKAASLANDSSGVS